MLVLTRKPGQTLRVGSDVRITIVSSSSRHVRVAIEAPDEVVVLREEVYERIAEANREASTISSDALATYAGRSRSRGGESS